MATLKKIAIGFDFGTWSSGFVVWNLIDPSATPFCREWPVESTSESDQQLHFDVKTRTAVILNETDALADRHHGAGSLCYDWERSKIQQMAAEGQEKYHHHFELHERFKLGLLNDDFECFKGCYSVQENALLDVRIVITEFLKWFLSETLEALPNVPLIPSPLDMKTDILWVFTVPCLFTVAEKEVMIKAASDAGFPDDIKFVQEPEAAALWVVHQERKAHQEEAEVEVEAEEEEGENVKVFEEGNTIVVVDAGGGTIDLSCHELLANGDLREITEAKSDAKFGSATINYNMFNTLKRTRPEVKAICRNRLTKGKLQAAIETEKILYDGEGVVALVVDDHPPFVISVQEMTKCFMGSVKAIFKLLRNQKKQLHEKGRIIDHVICVGGLSESQVVFKTVTNFCRKKLKVQGRVFRPNHARSAVMFGAALYGSRPSSIETRISRVTYGIATKVRYDPQYEFHRDRVDHLCTVGDEVYLRSVFKPFIFQGDPVEEDDVTELLGPFDAESELEFRVFATDKVDVSFVDELVDSPSTYIDPKQQAGIRDLTEELRRVRLRAAEFEAAQEEEGEGGSRTDALQAKLKAIAEQFGCRVEDLQSLLPDLARRDDPDAPNADGAAEGDPQQRELERIAERYGVPLEELKRLVVERVRQSPRVYDEVNDFDELVRQEQEGEVEDLAPAEGRRRRRPSAQPQPLLKFVVSIPEEDLSEVRAVYLRFVVGSVRLRIQRVLEFNDGTQTTEDVEGEIPLNQEET